MIKALLWDIDGTLIDTTNLVIDGLDHAYLKYYGRSMPAADIRNLVGIPLAKQLQILGDPAEHGTTLEEMESEFIRYWEARKDEERILTPVINTLIAGKKAGYPTALVTSKNRVEINNPLPRMGILPYVDLIICADDVTNPKPDPEGVRKALAFFEVEPEEAVFIGDSIHDMRAGEAAGVQRCGVTWGAATEEQIRAENPEFLCNKMDELGKLLRITGATVQV